MVYIFLAEGFEIVEAMAPADMLTRAGITVKLVGVTGDTVSSSAGFAVKCDCSLESVDLTNCDMVILPGGMPGTTNLEACDKVLDCVKTAYNAGKFVCAICAAPSILGHLGLLSGISATCFPGFETELVGANYTGSSVERVGNIITARGAGVAVEFGLACVSALAGDSEAKRIHDAIQI